MRKGLTRIKQFVMLDKRADRPASLLAKQEAEQHSIASTFVPNKSTTDPKANLASQKCRERNGASYLLQLSEEISMANLNTYCKKTKVILEENTTRAKGSSNIWSCRLIYKSVARTVSAEASSLSKKRAKRMAALDLLKAIKLSIENIS